MAQERIEITSEMSEFQQIMTHIKNGDHFLLSGGAGSGKTYSLVEVIRQVILDNPSTKVACITYTNAAVKEIEDRINHKNLKVSTIHDFLWDNIKHFQKELKQAIINLCNDQDVSKLYINGVANIPNEFFDDREEPLYIRYKEYLKLKDGIISHDELLIVAEYMFCRHPKLCDIVKDRYKYIFIDEYQDTQKEVVDVFLNSFAATAKRSILGFFGDTMQAIYDDGIGNIDLYKNGVNSPVKEVKKSQNRRNPQSVINLANLLRFDGIIQTPSSDSAAPNMAAGVVKDGNIVFLYSDNEDLGEVRAYLQENNDWDFGDLKATKELNLTHNLIAGKAGFRTLMSIYDKDPIVYRISLLNKFIRKRHLHIEETDSFEYVNTEIEKTITTEMSSLGLRQFTVTKYFQYLKSKYTAYATAIENLKNSIGKISDNIIPADKKKYVSRFISNTGIEEMEYIYEINLLKEIIKGIQPDSLGLYNSIKDDKYISVQNLYFDKDHLIDDKKQSEEDESRKGSKRDALISHLYRIQSIISLYVNGNYNEFIKKTECKKITSIADKKNLKNAIESVVNAGDKSIEDIIQLAHDTGLCIKGDKLNEFIEEKKYLYNRVKAVQFSEFQSLFKYIEGQTPYSTQHKTKGAEYDNVLVILDNGKWNKFNFESLFTNVGSDSVKERTRKIFYVCCTRAKEKLAIFYHQPSEAVVEKSKEMFGSNAVFKV